jgi:hypothetical protein
MATTTTPALPVTNPPSDTKETRSPRKQFQPKICQGVCTPRKIAGARKQGVDSSRIPPTVVQALRKNSHAADLCLPTWMLLFINSVVRVLPTRPNIAIKSKMSRSSSIPIRDVNYLQRRKISSFSKCSLSRTA